MTIIKIIITAVAIVLAGCVERQKQGANTMEYYNFVIQGQPVGYFEIEHTDTLIYMNAKMIMGSDKFENPFWIRVRNGVPYEVKFGSDNSEWKKVPLGAYPTSAYPLLLNDNIEKYSAYVEGSGELRERRLVNESGFIVEYDENNEIRRFKIESGKVVSISWGGSAVSTLQNSRDAAIHGTEFK